MTILFNAVEIKHERRVRLIFSQPLDTGAFGAPSPAFYTVTCQDSLGSDPVVSAAMIVASDPSLVELALDRPLALGSLYSISAVAVPAVDLSVTPGGSVLEVRFGVNAPMRDVEPILQNRDDILYGVDLLWNGADYQESANGDLERVSGTANVTKALYRGIEARGLTWDQTYGAHIRDFVDSPSTTAGTMKGNVQSQILRDPRVKSVKTEISTDDETTYLLITPTLVSGEVLKPVSMVVPSG